MNYKFNGFIFKKILKTLNQSLNGSQCKSMRSSDIFQKKLKKNHFKQNIVLDVNELAK